MVYRDGRRGKLARILGGGGVRIRQRKTTWTGMSMRGSLVGIRSTSEFWGLWT